MAFLCLKLTFFLKKNVESFYNCHFSYVHSSSLSCSLQDENFFSCLFPLFLFPRFSLSFYKRTQTKRLYSQNLCTIERYRLSPLRNKIKTIELDVGYTKTA